MSKKSFSFNSLMKHLRSNGIMIAGSSQKRALMLSGYYHGYKGYRFSRDPKNRLPITNYAELQSLIDYDEKIKALLYTPVMQLETAFKSIVSEIVSISANSDSLSVIINKLMQSHLHKKEYIKRKYAHRDEIYSTLTKQYSKSNIVKHYYSNDLYVPIWAIFEVITLGQFAEFVSLLDPKIRLEISEIIDIPININTDGKLMHKVLLQLRDIRNAIAHNKPIFDGRYSDRDTAKTLTKFLENKTHIKGIQFETLTDDIILILTLMKSLGFKKSILIKYTKTIIEYDYDLYATIPSPIYMKIFNSDNKSKLKLLLNYIKS